MYLLSVIGFQFVLMVWSMIKFLIKMHSVNSYTETQEQRLQILENIVANLFDVQDQHTFLTKPPAKTLDDSESDSDASETFAKKAQ